MEASVDMFSSYVAKLNNIYEISVFGGFDESVIMHIFTLKIMSPPLPLFELELKFGMRCGIIV